MPNFNSLRRLEVAFFGRFLRPPLLALVPEAGLRISEVTLEAHGKFHSRRGKISYQLCLLYGLEIFVAAAVIKGITSVIQCYNNKSNHRAGISLPQSLASGPAMEKWIMFVLTHSTNFSPSGIFSAVLITTDECFQRAVHVEDPRGRLFHCPFQLYGKKRSGKNETKGT